MMFRKIILLFITLCSLFLYCNYDKTLQTAKAQKMVYRMTIKGLTITSSEGDTVLSFEDTLSLTFSIDSMVIRSLQDSLSKPH